MPNELKKITALPSGTPADNDVIPFVDLATNTTKKALKSELKGDKGDTGTAATVDAGTTTTLAAGQSASVTNVGTPSAAIFNFAIPQGIQGIPGADGANGACVESVAFVGNDIVFTLDDSSAVTLTNAKVTLKGDKGDTGAKITSAEFVLDDLVFTLDDSSTVTITGAKTALKGDKGDTGLTGPAGADGIMASVVAGTNISVDATDPANPIVTADLSKVDTKPTDLKISTASKGGVLRNIDGAVGDTPITSSGWIEDEKFGIRFIVGVNSVSTEFDSAVTRTGRLTLKISTINTAGRARALLGNQDPGTSSTIANLSKYQPEIKPLTRYKITCYVKTSNVANNGVFMGTSQYNSSAALISGTSVESTKLTGNNDWTPLSVTFTSHSTAKYLSLAFYSNTAGNISDAWFDVNSMTLEEVVTDTTFTGKVAEKIRPVLQAVTSTDNIDQSLDPTGAYANTYALTNAVNEGATHIQTFTPTKKYTTRIGVWVVAKGTGDWTLAVHNAANDLLASQTIANDSLVDGAFNYFNVPNIWASGALHFHLYSSVADGTCKANTSNDLETASYIHNYAKKTESFSLIANGIKTDLKADKDGLLSNAIIDLDNGKYRYYKCLVGGATTSDFKVRIPGDNERFRSDLYSVSGEYRDTNYPSLQFSSGFMNPMVLKVNTILPSKNIKLKLLVQAAADRYYDIHYSLDNITWVALDVATNANDVQLNYNFNVNQPTFFVRIQHNSGGNKYLKGISIEADLDTSSIPQGLFYPIGVNQFAETWKANDTVRSYVYRQAKYTNEYGVVMPAIELNSGATGAGTALGYIPLKIDNSQETTPAITILASSGVASDTTLDADGEYVALSSGATEGSVNYQVTITKNTLYLSSNGDSVDSTQDPSHQGNFIVGIRQQGALDRIKDLGEETEDIKKGLSDTKELVRNNALMIGFDAGTTDAYEIDLQDFTGYKAGMSVIFKANTANTDGATLNINGMGAKAIVKGVDTALSSNDILANMYCHCVFDGTNFVLLNPRAL